MGKGEKLGIKWVFCKFLPRRTYFCIENQNGSKRYWNVGDQFEIGKQCITAWKVDGHVANFMEKIGLVSVF